MPVVERARTGELVTRRLLVITASEPGRVSESRFGLVYRNEPEPLSRMARRLEEPRKDAIDWVPEHRPVFNVRTAQWRDDGILVGPPVEAALCMLLQIGAVAPPS